ncbi:hypothetical protein [Blastococcus sp. URHD0036]|uniref:hypothetical protein n=1 Tax=Blastococcus sp. URHD0036 TaxID=1380356 RepID=UPI000495E719|nr:hypothetical protein [Blastococcus sp. URHD0036]
MRRPLPYLVPAVLAAGLLLSGCSDEVDGSAAPATTPSTSSSSSAPTSASPTIDPDLEDFCTDGEALFGEVDDAFTNAEGMGSTAFAEVLQQAVDAFDALEPPDEIAADWQASRDGFAALRDAVAAIDPAAPDAEQQAVDVIAGAETTVGPAFQDVSDWIDENCPES